MSYLGQDIPKLGFGLMRLPKDGDEILIPQVEKMVDAFLEAGGLYFDTARGYPGSEAAIRKALVERYPRDRYLIATKNACWMGCKDANDARQLFYTSLDELGLDYVDFYLLHNLGDKRTAYFDEFHMWDFVRELKEEGKVKHIGFSLHDTADVLERILDDHPEMEFVQLQVNYADWEDSAVQSRRCMEVAKAHGKPVIIMEPVRGGTLSNPPKLVADVLEEADPYASPVSWALRFALGLDNIITVLSGMSSLEQMEDNLTIWKNFTPLSSSEMDTLKKAQGKLASVMENNCTSCHYCMAECPEGIDISNMMQALNRAAAYGHENGLNWYEFTIRNGKPKASDCIKCGACEAACPQSVPIISQLEKAVDRFEKQDPEISKG